MILHLATRKGERGAPAEYEPHEYADARSMYLRAASLGPCVERTELIGSILTMHELKTMLDAHVLTETERTNLGLDLLEVKVTDTTLVSEPVEPVQQTMIPPEGTESMLFRIPEKARRKLGIEADNVSVVDEVEYVREEAIERADRAVTQEWKDHAHEVIRRTCLRLPEFTSEDVWDTGLAKPDTGSADGDALGPAMRRARTAGFCEPTDRTTTETRRAQRHNNPKRIWRSAIYQQEESA